jgi:hypothetical protein
MASNVLDVLQSLVFKGSGMKPWKLGYGGYKRRLIKDYVEKGLFSPGQLETGYGYRVDERIIEYPWMFSKLNGEPQTMLDAGSVLNFDYILDLPPLRQKKLFISTLAPEKRNYAGRGISYIFEDLRASCFGPDYFDVIVSLSTIEHIGLDNTILYTNDPVKKEARGDDYLIAIDEYKRILKPGGKVLLSFPFGARCNRGWFQVFDQPMVDKIIDRFQPQRHEESYFKYTKSGWIASTAEGCADATTFDIHQDKEYGEDMAAFSRAVCCIELVK